MSRGLEQTTRRLARLVDEAWGSGWPGLAEWAPEAFRLPADLEETDGAYVVEVELPGVQKKDVEVGRAPGARAGRHAAATDPHRRALRLRGRPAGRRRRGRDPRASHGRVLTVTVPKTAAERQQRRQIPVE